MTAPTEEKSGKIEREGRDKGAIRIARASASAASSTAAAWHCAQQREIWQWVLLLLAENCHKEGRRKTASLTDCLSVCRDSKTQEKRRSCKITNANGDVHLQPACVCCRSSEEHNRRRRCWWWWWWWQEESRCRRAVTTIRCQSWRPMINTTLFAVCLPTVLMVVVVLPLSLSPSLSPFVLHFCILLHVNFYALL